MDCRKGLWVTLALLGSAAGCQHFTGGPQPPPPTPTASTTKPTGTSSMLTWDRTPPPEPAKKKTTTPEVCVSYGNFRLGESLGDKYDATMRDRLQEDARDAYQKALALDPKHVPAFRGLAHLYVLRRDYPRAIEQFQKALQVAPGDATLWYDAGICANHAQQWDKAVAALQKAGELDPQNRTYGNALGVVLARLGRCDESFKAFARMNSEAQAHFNLGCTLRRLGDSERARQHLALAVQKDPQLSTAQTLLAEISAPKTTSPIQRVEHTEPVPENLNLLPQRTP
jgi:tetratricopeptide (TPR) repeat protein